jgi:hypothetical protein
MAYERPAVDDIMVQGEFNPVAPGPTGPWCVCVAPAQTGLLLVHTRKK